MKLVKNAFGLLLVLVLALCVLTVSAAAEEGEYVYLSISFDGQYIDGQTASLLSTCPFPWIPSPLLI